MQTRPGGLRIESMDPQTVIQQISSLAEEIRGSGGKPNEQDRENLAVLIRQGLRTTKDPGQLLATVQAYFVYSMGLGQFGGVGFYAGVAKVCIEGATDTEEIDEQGKDYAQLVWQLGTDLDPLVMQADIRNDESFQAIVELVKKALGEIGANIDVLKLVEQKFTDRRTSFRGFGLYTRFLELYMASVLVENNLKEETGTETVADITQTTKGEVTSV